MLKNLILSTSLLLTAVSVSSAQSYLGLHSDILTEGNAVTESWNNFTPAAYPTYPASYSGNKIPDTIANINATALNPATLIHVNGGAASGNPSAFSPAFITAQNGYYGIYNSSPAANGTPTGQYRVQKDSVISDLKTIGFLLESTPRNGQYFTPTGAPVLIINGDYVNSVFVADFNPAAYTGTIVGESSSTTVAQNYFQWDVSDYVGTINSFSIEFNVASHALILGLQVSQSDAIYGAAAIPEPSTYALIGAGLAGAAFLRRRRKAA